MMEIDEDEILRTVASTGAIDFSVWSTLLPRIVSRIERITRYEFPIPNLPPPASTIIPSSIPPPSATQPESEQTENFLSPLPSSPIEQSSLPSSQDTNKENTPVAPRMSAPSTSASAPAPAPAAPLPPGALPPQISSMLAEITSTLISTFPKYPPHTIQRLAELVLVPKQHYRTLPTYLHALDRVVHVTSGLNIYPLPPAVPDIKTASLLSNGITDALAVPSPFATPGSDEALGGALLTPIPWLQPNHHGIGGPSSSALGTPGQRSPNGSRSPNSAAASAMGGNELEGEVRTESTETIDGPNGVGSIETVSVSVNGIPSMGARGIGVTQGELLRQEQRAGVVPVSHLVPSHHVHSANPHAQVHRRASATPTAESSMNPGAAAAAAGQASAMEAERKSVSPPNADPSSAPANADNNPSPNPDAPLGSVAGSDEEKPHARGPEEIGPEDMGPQPGGSTGSASTTIGGVEMQGIDVEAAVGRKASRSSRSPPKTTTPPKTTNPAEEVVGAGGDKMDVESNHGDKEPKREAEDPLQADDAKKLRESEEPEPTGTAAETGAGEGEGADTAMDTTADGDGASASSSGTVEQMSS
ncbi:hypothetical protein F5Y04DRAFT_257739 [Hypomontagnella monticulosa]|nr:hypothetical protein F5Y04DRAFT_257739 [Hypomontagnella monticulosa]